MPTSAEGEESSNDSSTNDAASRRGSLLVNITETGDLILDITFKTSAYTLKKARRAELASARKAGTHLRSSRRSDGANPPGNNPTFQPVVKVAYRVDTSTLRKSSLYFANLLSNSHFAESNHVKEVHASLAAQGLKPAEADAEALPWIHITDDDEADQAAGREAVFEDLFTIMHSLPVKSTTAAAAAKPTMAYITSLAIAADRFDCRSLIARSLHTGLKFRWPITAGKPLRNESGKPTDVELVLRQKILVSWLLQQPPHLHQSTRDLLLRGSRMWTTFEEEAEGEEGELNALWWRLPDGLEQELQFRRHCILNTLSSVQQHFLRLYSSRERQCKLGYDSSAACDSFQLGQMLRFLVSKKLLFLVDFSPASLDGVQDTNQVDIEELLVTLKQCPNYQIDKNHTNCGLRIRIDPILDFLRAMLSSNVVSIPHTAWKTERASVTWATHEEMAEQRDRNGYGRNQLARDENGAEEADGQFCFTRAMANDQRYKMVQSDSLAKRLFTAHSWNWTPEL